MPESETGKFAENPEGFWREKAHILRITYGRRLFATAQTSTISKGIGKPGKPRSGNLPGG
jgi:hypothetical protein